MLKLRTHYKPVPGVTTTAALSTEEPIKVVALIVKLYSVPFTNPFMIVLVTTFTATVLTTPASAYEIV